MKPVRLFLLALLALLLCSCTAQHATVSAAGSKLPEDAAIYDDALKSLNDGEKLGFCYSDAKISLNIAGFRSDVKISRNEARSMASTGLKGARLQDEYRMIERLYDGKFDGPTAYAMDRFSACSDSLGLAPGTATMALIETCMGLLNKSRHAFLMRDVMSEQKAEEYMVRRNPPDMERLVRKIVHDAYQAHNVEDMVAIDRNHFYSCLSANA